MYSKKLTCNQLNHGIIITENNVVIKNPSAPKIQSDSWSTNALLAEL